jgi:hypothetical protein
MLQLVKILSFPALLFASLFTTYAAQYELALNLLVCLGAVAMIQRAIGTGQYIWAAELVAIAVVFSPFVLLVKLFLLMGLAFTVACVALWTALRRPLAPVWEAESEPRA